MCEFRRHDWSSCQKAIVSRQGDVLIVDDQHESYPSEMAPQRPPVAAPEPPAPGLGDMTASALSSVGITKERAQAVAKWLGFSDCGCPGRQAWMNSVGAKYFGLPPGGTESPRPTGE